MVNWITVCNLPKIELLTYKYVTYIKGTLVKNHLWLDLDTEHWLELVDKKHRYGSNLKVFIWTTDQMIWLLITTS